MNRFSYSTPILEDGEYTVAVENNVRLYDGDQKVTQNKNVSLSKLVPFRLHLKEVN